MSKTLQRDRLVPDISIIIPVFNEESQIFSALEALKTLKSPDCRSIESDPTGRNSAAFETPGVELIVVDGGSDDGTLQRLEAAQQSVDVEGKTGMPEFTLLQAPKGRASQMNAGAASARGELLLFLHCDTTLPENALKQLANLPETLIWGRFDIRFSNLRWPFKVIAWFVNQRSRLSGIATGDQAMFVRKSDFFRLGAYPRQPLMEDVELSKRLKSVSRPLCLRSKVTTSARKWEQGGIIKTVLLMWRLRARYAFGAKPEMLAKLYYR